MNKVLLIIMLIIVIIGAIILGFYFKLAGLIALVSHTQKAAVNPTTGIYLENQMLLLYSNASYIVPYFLVNYNSKNASNIYFYATLFKERIPQTNQIYILNTTNDCVNCNNASSIISNIAYDLIGYKIISSAKQLTIVNPDEVQGIRNNSILIMLNGRMPDSMLKNVNGTMPLTALLNKGTSIIYVGENFSQVVHYGPILIPNNFNMPFIFSTYNANVTASEYKNINNNSITNLYFDNATFSFSYGEMYGSVSYLNAYNGSLIAFSNYPDQTNANMLAQGIAKAISELFWMPAYTNGTASVPVNLTATGNIGLMLNNPLVSASEMGSVNNSYARIIARSNYSYMPDGSYSYIYYKPSFSVSGIVSMPGIAVPNTEFFTTFKILKQLTGGMTFVLYWYNSNYSMINATPLSFVVNNISSVNYTFINSTLINLRPGAYISSLKSFNGYMYGSALTVVPAFRAELIKHNYTTNNFTFEIFAGNALINGLYYNVSLNGKYSENGIIENGVVQYNLPKGAGEMFGNLIFNFNVLSSNFTYTAVNPKFKIQNEQRYIIIGIVAVVVVILMMIRAPPSDEFYIDVPTLPRPNVIDIKLKADALTAIFEKQNQFYHWRYMPLAKEEVRNAVVNNIKYNNLPVMVTYRNVERVLTQLTSLGYLVSADDLYAPKSWIEKSGHDIEYLAAFKKLRVWFVFHGYTFTDIDVSNLADIVATINGESAYYIIYSKTSRFKNIKVYEGVQTYLVFLNSSRLEEFTDMISNTFTVETEKVKLFMSGGLLKLLNADNPDEMLY